MKYSEVLSSYSARHIFEFDKEHLDRCDCAVLVLPAGKSGHLELGYVIGRGKPGYILMDGEPERVDIMHSFATKVFMNQEEMIEHFKSEEQYPRVYGNTIEQPALQSGFWQTPSLTYLRGDAPLITDAKCSPQLRGTEVRSPQLEEGSSGEVQGREVPTLVGRFRRGWF